MILIQTSDFHVNEKTDVEEVKRRIRLMHDTIVHELNDDTIVFCVLGDFIDMGDASQFERAGQIISEIKTVFQNDGDLTFQFVPGNHDLCSDENEKNLRAFNQFIQSFDVKYSFDKNRVIIQDYPELTLILVSSVSHYDIKYGAIPIHELKSKIQSAAKPFIVLTHHSLLSDNDNDISMIRDSSDLSNLMQNSNFIGFLHGHTHGYKNVLIENCRLIGVGPFLKEVPDVPNQFNLIKIHCGKIFSINNFFYRRDYGYEGNYGCKNVFEYKKNHYRGMSVYQVWRDVEQDFRTFGNMHNLIITIDQDMESFFRDISIRFAEKKQDAEELILKTGPKKTINLPHGHIPVNQDGTDALSHAIQQLKREPFNTHAIIPVISFDNVVQMSGNKPLSALDVIQLSVDAKDKTLLHITEYFRSMEVYNYLPLNLYEAKIIAERVSESLWDIQKINLVMHVFLAEFDENKKSANKLCELDSVSAEKLVAYLADKNYDKLITLFEEKHKIHNYEFCDCFVRMKEAIDICLEADINIHSDLIRVCNDLYDTQEKVLAQISKAAFLPKKTFIETKMDDPVNRFICSLQAQKKAMSADW